MTTITTYQAVPPLPLTAPFDATLEPAAYLVQALEYIATLDERPTPDYCREVAALEDVITYPDELQQTRYDHHRTQLLNGAVLATATPDELRRDALALFGLAKDRQVNGEWALEPEVWVNAAHEALETYRARKNERVTNTVVHRSPQVPA